MPKNTALPSRRSFLGLAAALGSGVAAVGAAQDPQPDVPAGSDDEPGQAADRYRETPHIQAAYARMRF